MLEELKVRVANARAALASPGAVVNAAGDRPPRYELFHAANSICSQKVRVVLAHHRLPYVDHTLDLFRGQPYLPDYVRLRMIGCGRIGGALVSEHRGSTSAEGGCDGAVVPTLIDWETAEVIVDSRRICIHLDDQGAEDRLRPAGLATTIDSEIAVVDHLPNYQMLMGRAVAAESAATKADTGGVFSQRKVAWCDRYLAEHGDDPTLVQAYTAKRAKELSAARTLFSPDAMRAAYDLAALALETLDAKLEQRGATWLFGERVTLADLFWAAELLRITNIGLASQWQGGRLPHVERFARAGEVLPAIRTAIVEWPGAMF